MSGVPIKQANIHSQRGPAGVTAGTGLGSSAPDTLFLPSCVFGVNSRLHARVSRSEKRPPFWAIGCLGQSCDLYPLTDAEVSFPDDQVSALGTKGSQHAGASPGVTTAPGPNLGGPHPSPSPGRSHSSLYLAHTQSVLTLRAGGWVTWLHSQDDFP